MTDVADVGVRIFSTNSDGRPNAELHVLTAPVSFAQGTNTFTADAGTELQATTTYAVVVTNGDASADPSTDIGIAAGNLEDPGAAEGWSISNLRFWRTNNVGWWNLSTTPINIEIKGIVKSGTTASADAALSSLALDDSGGDPVALSPAFAAATTEYMASVANSVSQITVTATANDENATSVEFLDENGATLMDADAAVGFQVDLDVGENIITVEVTAQDGVTTQEYAVVVTRTAGTLALNVGTIAGDDTVNIAEKAAGFAIGGDTGSESGVAVSVTIGSQSPLTATSDANGQWSVSVPADAAYITGTSVAVTVSASKTGFDAPDAVQRTLTVDLAAPAVSYTAPATLQVGVAVNVGPSTTDTDIASYSASGLPSGLAIDGTGAISGTPETADANTASVTVTVTDAAGNPAEVALTFPAVAKGDQTLTGFKYSASSVVFGSAAPTVTAPTGAQTTLSYSATPSTVCTVDSGTGALTIVAAGECVITVTAAADENYNEATDTFTVMVQSAGTLALNVGTIAGDDTVNIAEKAAGFAISGDTGSESGVAVSVTIGSQSPLTATSDANGQWSVSVPADAAYITGTSVAVTVSASKTGFDAPDAVQRTLTVDLAAPAVSYTAPATLQVEVAVSMAPSTADTDIDSYSASGLPSGLAIDAGTGVIGGTPDRADADTASATVRVTDAAGNAAEVSIAFPAVAKGDQTLSGFGYSASSVTFGSAAPTVTAPTGAHTALSYSATPSTVCTVDSGTGALTIVAAGECVITVTAAADENYNEATDTFTVTVQSAGTLAGEPTNLSATTIGKTRNRLSWTAPEDTGGDDVAITGYLVEYSAPDHLLPSDTNVWEVLEADTGSASTTYDHDHELAPGVRLEYRVSAINALGAGDASNVDDATTPAAPDTAGNGAPEHTRITVNHRRVEIAFDENLDTGSVPRRVAFQVTIKDSFERPESVDVMDAAVVLTLEAADAVDADDSVRVRYLPPVAQIGDALVPLTTEALQDLEGNLVENWGAPFAVNETPGPGVTVAPTALTVLEGGSETYTVVLDSAPEAPVTVDIAAGGDVSVDPASLTFGTTDWKDAQTVTVSAGQDEDKEDDSVTLVHTARSGDQDYEGVDVPSVAVTVEDDDALAMTLSETLLEVNEGGTSTYTAVLDAEPEQDVVIGIYVEPFSNPGFTLEPANPSPAPPDFPLSRNGSFDTLTFITFTTSDWNVAQTVTVHAPAADADGTEESAYVQHGVDPGDGSLRMLAGLTVKTIDPDAEPGMPAVVVSTTALTVPEGGRGTYALGTSGDHTGNVFVNIESSDPGVRVSPATVQFNRGNWDVEQRVTVSVSNGASDATLTHSIDTDRTTGDVQATVDSVAVTVGAQPSLSVADAEATEGDPVMEFVVTLDTPATATITVDYATADGTAAAPEDYVATSGTLTFDAGDSEKTIEVPIHDDRVEDDAETFTVVLSNASRAAIADGEARGTIRNTEAVADPPVENSAATGAPTISGRAQVDETLTASVSGIDDADGLENVRYAYQWIRGNTDIGGATDSTYTLVDADEGQTIKVRVSFTDDAGNAETLTSAATAAVAAAPEPLTASFSGVPAEHAGEGRFTFDLTFSEHVEGLSYKTLRDEAFDVSGGTVRRAKRKQSGRNQHWTIHVEPASHGPVTIRLPAGSVETADGRALSNSSAAAGAGPVGISVADARVEEAAGAVLEFVVTLSRAAGAAFTVAYQTADGSAHAGDDYTAANGTLSFQVGDTSKTIEVAVLDDAHDEDEETLTLTLSNASSGRLTDAEATGTIENHDPMPRALLARFGRTAAVHVVEHVEERMAAPREPGFRGRFAGRELRRGMERDIALSFLSQLGGASGGRAPGLGGAGSMADSPAAGVAALGKPGHGGAGMGMAASMGSMMGVGARPGALGAGMGLGSMGAGAEPDGVPNSRGRLDMGLGSMVFGGDSLLTGSAFALNRETRSGGILSFWSRGAQSHFAGREGALSLGGDVRTTMVGADYATGPLVAGLSLSHSRGLGEYAGATGGQVASSVTGLYPWLGYKATDRVTVWGVAGYGAGGLRLTPQGGPALTSGLSMAMAAAGTRGELVAGGAGGFALAFKADALWVGTSIDGVDGAAGRLAATAAAVTRYRTGLEGSRAYTLAGRLSLRPSVEVGLRHDGGDAETGAGLDVGGGLVMADASTGLAVDVRVRTLLVHQAEGFSERGVAVSLSYTPTPSTPLGFVARVAPSWGGQATSGAEALWGRETMAGLAPGGVADGTRLDAELGYGLPVGSRFVGTPTLGVGTTAYGRDYRLGYRLGAIGGAGTGTTVELGVEAERRERPLPGGTDHGALARATVRW